ncbi:MAG: AAA family ATPase [Polyangiales bacterium]
MSIDWSALQPHAPLSPNDARFVPRIERPSLVERALQSDAPIAVVGPVGSGKSTSLARFARELSERRPNTRCVPVLRDHLRHHMPSETEALLSADPTRLLGWCMLALISYWVAPGLISESDALDELNIDEKRPPTEQLRLVARATKEKLHADRLVLLLDGLERANTAEIQAALDELLRFHDDFRLVAVLPAQAMYGDASAWIHERFRMHFIPAVEPTGAGRDFLREVVRRRIGETPAALEAIVDEAITQSGGIPRTLLQLVQDAGSYATLAGRELPLPEDLTLAVQDHRQSLRRLLDKDDKRALLDADGTDGSEIELPRRARLIAHGLLLEYQTHGDLVVHPAPMLRPILAPKAA